MPNGDVALPESLRERIEECRRQIAAIGVVLRGSVTKRYIACGKPGCRCQASPPRLHGPYYQWSRKVGGKTVSVRITEAQARILESWIANSRRLDRLVSTWEAVGLKAAKLIPE